MARNSRQIKNFEKRLTAIPRAVREALTPTLLKSGEELVASMRQLAESSRDTGGLINSIAVTGPGQQTPAYSQPGGSLIVAPLTVAVTAGNSQVRYAHLVEHGTAAATAQPFFWPGYRLGRKRLEGRIKRAISKAIKDAKR
ncbi:HK97 gp10 family phage protein [Rhodoligotrophos appendicifer]|uniref:HK97 gp10 family phage protein n=1 Tax=Rhodoligotrophos appendicifer TaxID=987056 RepID=UPI001186BBE0|nr:HK97 gp10 family phage protein [Rhodoligotrophos appendicifer]